MLMPPHPGKDAERVGRGRVRQGFSRALQGCQCHLPLTSDSYQKKDLDTFQPQTNSFIITILFSYLTQYFFPLLNDH